MTYFAIIILIPLTSPTMFFAEIQLKFSLQKKKN